MTEKKSKSPDNDIPEEIQLRAGKFARTFMKLPPMTRKEPKENWTGKKKNSPFRFFLKDGLCSIPYNSHFLITSTEIPRAI